MSHSHQYQNNHNTTIVGGQGATYNAPVSYIIPPNKKNDWVYEWLNDLISPMQDSAVVNQDCLRLYHCINKYADAKFSKQLHQEITNASTNKGKIGTVKTGLSNLLKHVRNRNVDHQNKKGIMSAIRTRYHSLKDMENKDMKNEDEDMEDENMLQKALQMSMENDNKEETIRDFNSDDDIDAYEVPPNADEINDNSASFKDFMLKQELMRAIGDAGFEYPSEAQIRALPIALLGRDMIVQANSGMGKTTVFVLGTLAQIQPETDIIDTLVLCHTREMALQIFGEFERFSKYMTDVQIGCVYGGIPFFESKRVIEQEKPHILIATPGRIVRLLETSVLRLNRLKRFIIDECDNMLREIDMRKQIQDIFKKTPHSKQVMIFSAIIGDSIKSVCRKFTKNAQEISVDKQLTFHGLQQYFVKLTEREKNRKLNDLLDALDFNQVVIFVRTKERAIELNKLLMQRTFPCVYIHSDMRQTERLRLFKAFREYKYRILISTNVFGRGVDIGRVNIVINYDMPQDSDEYFHRVSRAKEFGKCVYITFVSNTCENQIINNVKTVFNANVTALPNQIQTSSYM